METESSKEEVAVIVQARMGSSRLPGKVLKELVRGESVLGFLLKRLEKCRMVNKIILASTTNPKDDVIEEWASERKCLFFRGSENNCIERYCHALEKFKADIVVRVTSDCPLVIPELVDDMISYYLAHRAEVDYLSNRQFTGFPDGVDSEVFTHKMLEEARMNASLQDEFEHINYYFLNRPEQYKIHYYKLDAGLDYSGYKLSVDTLEELEFCRSLFRDKGLPLDFSFPELMDAITGGN